MFFVEQIIKNAAFTWWVISLSFKAHLDKVSTSHLYYKHLDFAAYMVTIVIKSMHLLYIAYSTPAAC